MLNRQLAPITEEAWKEIDERAKEVLRSYLSARKVVSVEGPRGWDYTAITEGRLENIREGNDVCFGNYSVLPLIEVRAEFEMNRWELDNIMRGAKDIDYKPLEKAVEKIALFEENAIYNGLKEAKIKGILDISKGNEITLGRDSTSILKSIAKGVLKLKEVYADSPYDLIIGKDVYEIVQSENPGYPLDRKIKDLIKGDIVFSHVIDGAVLIPHAHEDLEFTIGQDFSIGYQSNDNKNVRFFITESFTFRILDPSIIVSYKL